MPDLLLELRSEEMPAQPLTRNAEGMRMSYQENMRAKEL
jgi:glycyl-tRNA synthetase beta subunit